MDECHHLSVYTQPHGMNQNPGIHLQLLPVDFPALELSEDAESRDYSRIHFYVWQVFHLTTQSIFLCFSSLCAPFAVKTHYPLVWEALLYMCCFYRLMNKETVLACDRAG